MTCTWTCTGAGGGTCTAAGSGNIGDTLNLPSGASITYTASCTLSAAASGTLNNTATVTAPGGVTDPTPGNNSATDTDTLIQTPSVSGIMTMGGTTSVGGIVIYTVVLTNSGGGTQPDNPGDEFADVLPSQVALLSATASSGTALANTGTNTVTWNGSLPPGGQVTISIHARVLSSAVGVTVTNQGTIAYDADVNGSNESRALTDDPTLAGSTDPTGFRGVPRPPGAPFSSVTPIPTLSPFGLLMLTLVTAGLVAGWRRRRRLR